MARATPKVKGKIKIIVFKMKSGLVVDFNTLTGLPNPTSGGIEFLETTAKSAMVVDDDIVDYRIEERGEDDIKVGRIARRGECFTGKGIKDRG